MEALVETVRAAIGNENLAWDEAKYDEALAALTALHDRVKELEQERDDRDELVGYLCDQDICENGCACSPISQCYLHGVVVPRVLADGWPEPSSDELRFMYAAGVEYVRAEAAEARVAELEGALRFYDKQGGLGAVLASDGGMKARAALAGQAAIEEKP